MAYQEPAFLPWDGRRVPLTFIGGYLGAGKTTAINEVLRQTDRPIAVIVNDVGAIGVDARLVRRRHGDTIELTDGCVCCSSIEELGAAFDRIRTRAVPPDHVIVELSGVAEPERMLPWGRSAGFVLDGLIVVVAADQLVEESLPAWVMQHLLGQIRAADLLVLTKTDLVDERAAEAALARLAELAPGTPVLSGGAGGGGSRSQPSLPGAIGRFLALGGRRPGGMSAMPDATLFDAHEVRTVAAPEGVTASELEAWLAALRDRLDGRLVRAKGIVDTTDDGLVLVQVVGARCEISVLPEPEREASTDLVVITLRT